MVITFKIGDKTQKEMADFYQEFKREKTPPYALFQAQNADCVITLYQSGKAVFQGGGADIEASIWQERDQKLHPENKQVEKKSDTKKEKPDKARYDANTIGSDEVGTGDFFGPIIVTSVLVEKQHVSFLNNLKIKDSKTFTDEEILKLAPQLMKKLIYESIVLTNEDYNKYYNETTNMNKIKAILHNKVLLKLSNRTKNYRQIVVDQFTTPKSYFAYLRDSKNVCSNIIFLKKAERLSLPVACASIISRYFFIKKMDELSKKYNVIIPYGANEKTDQIALELAKKHDVAILGKLVKLNFKNYQRVLAKLEE